MNDVNISITWSDKVKSLLDTYLSEFGLRSSETRAFWIDQVIEFLVSRAELVANEDILEESVERMHNLIEARVAMASGFDPVHQQKEIAQVIVVLLNENNADCLNSLFESNSTSIDATVLANLQKALVTSSLIPVPPEAPLAMPVQSIELRSFNPLRSLFGRLR